MPISWIKCRLDNCPVWHTKMGATCRRKKPRSCLVYSSLRWWICYGKGTGLFLEQSRCQWGLVCQIGGSDLVLLILLCRHWGIVGSLLLVSNWLPMRLLLLRFQACGWLTCVSSSSYLSSHHLVLSFSKFCSCTADWTWMLLLFDGQCSRGVVGVRPHELHYFLPVGCLCCQIIR